MSNCTQFNSKFSLDEVLSTNFGGDLVKVKAVTFSSDAGVIYSCRRTDGDIVLMCQDELNNDDPYKDEGAAT